VGEVNKRLDAEKEKLQQKVGEQVGDKVGGAVEKGLKGLFNK